MRPSGKESRVDDLHEELDRRVPASGLLGYLNFSQGKPDPRWQRQLDEAYRFFDERGVAAPWRAIRDWLTDRLETLRAAGGAFQDVTQAAAVLPLAFDTVPAAYRRHH